MGNWFLFGIEGLMEDTRQKQDKNWQTTSNKMYWPLQA